MATSPAARTRSGFVVARVLLVDYLLFVGFTVWLPATISAKVTGLVGILAKWIAARGIADYYSSAVVLEFLANVALFVPIGLLLALGWTRLRLWQVVVVGAAMTVVIEAVQGFMPSRSPTISDLIANTLGTFLGAAIVAVVILLLEVPRPEESRRLIA
ncbi:MULTISPECIES: VanZ family protein [unclassified Microbacterium]|uniref:VanZ family protein n=1 Tax=unclassified Microbacterium TaxID=2609290 RepID=UPI000EA859BA|nr:MULTISPECIES: VanZ family protein [unclassified Microbacterium]MBT2485013.1 VanZ family protein [Microbacterium sp. ISL-108]RKN67863.1 VanZ family protein [Microbacterium sp. CGR2]